MWVMAATHPDAFARPRPRHTPHRQVDAGRASRPGRRGGAARASRRPGGSVDHRVRPQRRLRSGRSRLAVLEVQATARSGRATGPCLPISGATTPRHHRRTLVPAAPSRLVRVLAACGKLVEMPGPRWDFVSDARRAALRLDVSRQYASRSTPAGSARGTRLIPLRAHAPKPYRVELAERLLLRMSSSEAGLGACVAASVAVRGSRRGECGAGQRAPSPLGALRRRSRGVA